MRLRLLCLGFLLIACHQGHGSATAPAQVEFAVVSHSQTGLPYLDDPIVVVCSAAIDPASVDAGALRIEASSGPGLGMAVRGSFEVDGATVGFWPDLPLGEDLADCGLRPDTTYSVVVVGADQEGAVPMLDLTGRPLAHRVAFAVTMPAAGTFRPGQGGPAFAAAVATPLDAEGKWLPGTFAGAPTEVELSFAGPLDPTEANLPRHPDSAAKGPLQLVYDDPVFGADTWIPARVELVRNDGQGASVILRPLGVLPNHARVRVLVTAELQALDGQRHSEPGWHGEVATVDTLDDYQPRFDALVARFDELDADANFAEPMAQVEAGALRSAEPPFGAGSEYDFMPTLAETILDTDGLSWVPAHGPVQTPDDGVVRVRNFHLPPGRVLRGIGSKPLVIVCAGECVVDGELTVSGGSAAGGSGDLQYRGPGEVTPPNPNAPPPPADPQDPRLWVSNGGFGECGGGHGGRRGPADNFGSYPGVRATTGRPGFGPGNVPGGGGQPGRLDCVAACGRASGGGGGAMATQGDPWFPTQGTASSWSFAQKQGIGGRGCSGASGQSSRALEGGVAGAIATPDTRRDNNFFGVGYDVFRGRRIRGELQAPVGGSGGGGGGDLSSGDCSPTVLSRDPRGGDGGGGGGVVIVQASGRIVVGRTGRIRADGGHGRGGDQAASCNSGGGGGGGAGGMVVLMSGTRIVLHSHGETFANRDYDFAISADGGVCRTGTFGTPVVPGKYPVHGQPVMAGTSYDAAPLGGFGGMGIVQLQAPIGDANQDGTNTVLDDGIDVLDSGGTPMTGLEKQRFLAWRGFADGQGGMVDDFGMPVAIGNDEGDIRPAPVLLPVPYGSRSRARSGWQAIGAVPRRSLTSPDGEPRGVVGGSGPQFVLPQLDDGWLRWRNLGAQMLPDGEVMLASPAPVNGAATERWRGLDSYVLGLGVSIATEPDRFAGMQAELLGAGGELMRTLPIRGSDGNRVWLEPVDVLPNGVVSLQVRDWTVQADYSGGPSPASYAGAGGARVPQSNVRLGFAFHRDPEHALGSGFDPDRLPHEVGTFYRGQLTTSEQQQLDQLGPSHVMWDVTMEQAYRRDANGTPPAWGFHTAPMRLLRLLVPFKY